MTYEQLDELLVLVNELGLEKEMAKLKGSSPEAEWKMLSVLVMKEIESIRERKIPEVIESTHLEGEEDVLVDVDLLEADEPTFEELVELEADLE